MVGRVAGIYERWLAMVDRSVKGKRFRVVGDTTGPDGRAYEAGDIIVGQFTDDCYLFYQSSPFHLSAVALADVEPVEEGVGARAGAAFKEFWDTAAELGTPRDPAWDEVEREVERVLTPKGYAPEKRREIFSELRGKKTDPATAMTAVAFWQAMLDPLPPDPAPAGSWRDRPPML